MIHWKLWTSVPTVKLWEAVALVLEIEPSDLRPHPGGWMAGPGHGPVFEARSFPNPGKQGDFSKALSFAERAANFAGPIHLRTGLARGMNKRTALVSLPEVVAYFVGVDWPGIPAPLLLLLPTAGSERTEVEAVPEKSPGTERRWTPELLAELANFRDAKGTKAAAEKYEISDSRIRELLPRDKPAPQGHSVFNAHRK